MQLQSLEEKIRLNAELVAEHLSQVSGFALGFDEESVAWLDGFIERQRSREDFDLESADGLIQKLGCYLGEALREPLSGEWKQLDEGLALMFNEGNAAFPINKVRKHFANGSEDSILSFYQTAVMIFRGERDDRP